MPNDTLDHLRQLNKRFIHNYVTNDVPSHDALLHPRFSYINSQGGRVNRADYLKAWAAGFDTAQLPYWDLRDEHIVLHENLALVSAANKFIAVENGKPTTGMAAYTDVYVREANQWLCLQAQITIISPSYWPSDETIICSYENGVLQKAIQQGVS